MNLRQFASSDALVDRYDYPDRSVLAIDFGPSVDVSVDVVEGTAIIVYGDEQRELDLPGDVVNTVNRNGVVTIEVDR